MQGNVVGGSREIIGQNSEKHLGVGIRQPVHGCLFGANPQPDADLHGDDARRQRYGGRGGGRDRRGDRTPDENILRHAERLFGPAEAVDADRLRPGGDHQAAVPVGGQPRAGADVAFPRPDRQGHTRCPPRCPDRRHRPGGDTGGLFRPASVDGYRGGVHRPTAGDAVPGGLRRRHPCGALDRRHPGLHRGGHPGVRRPGAGKQPPGWGRFASRSASGTSGSSGNPTGGWWRSRAC